jgi:hypothetical protein
MPHAEPGRNHAGRRVLRPFELVAKSKATRLRAALLYEQAIATFVDASIVQWRLNRQRKLHAQRRVIDANTPGPAKHFEVQISPRQRAATSVLPVFDAP